MKKIIGAIIAITVIFVGFGSCTKKETASLSGPRTFRVGISKIVSHIALDTTEQGIQDELAERGIPVTFDLQNANGDVNTAAQIAQKFLTDKVDAVVAIATPNAIAAANTIKDKPVIFSVITDPVAAGLVNADLKGQGNVTGLSDMPDVLSHLTLFVRVAKIKTLGHIYTSSEANSASSLEQIEKACKSLGLTLITQSINNSSEVKQATQALIKRVDGIYLTTDNTVFSALPALLEVAAVNKKPVFSSDTTSAAEGGCLIASGFDYYKAGRATGVILADVLLGKKPSDIPVKFLSEPSEMDFLIDLDAAKNCGITFPQDILESAGKIFENGKLTTK
ncbi:MAG TPA: ABC transporter substrate-binding protein [Treponemataceae bacterium]|nr:ABC transporter substrate-binding protein [Treponemataceae bacterium]